MSKTKILLTILLCVVTQLVMAQRKVISGTVSDDMGPIMMANVTERDGNNRIVSACQTDMMGNFSMEVKSPKNKLIVSYVGSKTFSKVIGDETTFDIKLQPENTTLNEVVVKSSRRNSGGLNIPKSEMSTSTQTFDLSEVDGMSFTSADEALQGQIAGLDIVSNSGNLGSGTTMRLRGVTTINGNAEPLIVVDEKVFDNPDESFDFTSATEEQYASLLSVNVEDIANIEVLKDAAATAIWGSKGANGVIKITTKRGSRGKPKVNFKYMFKGTWQPDGYTLLNGDDYTMLMKEEFYNPSQSNTATTYIRELNYDTSWAEYENWNNNTDWVNAVSQFGAQHDYSLSISGGGDKATFRISGGYKHQTGSIIKQAFDQLTTRLVLDYNVSDRIRFSTNFALTYNNNEQNYADLLAKAQQMAPNMSIYRQDAAGNDLEDYYIMNPQGTNSHLTNNTSAGTPYYGTGSEYSSYEMRAVRSIGNPVAIANMAWKKDQNYRIDPDFTLKYELLGTGAEQTRLTFTGDVNFDIYARSVPTYSSAGLSTSTWTESSYNVTSNAETNRLRVECRADLVFTPYFKNEDFYLTMLGRYKMSTAKSNSQSITQYELPNGITSPTVDAALSSLSSSNSRSAEQSLIYNGHFSYKGRYILGFSLTADGNSKFGPKNKWALFPGASLRYNVSDEPFFKPLKKVVSMIGLRASWGIVGKAPDADYLFYNTYNTSAGSYYGVTTASLDGLKLDDLRWEKTTSYNLGFNLGFLDDIIEMDFDYYHKDTKDLLQKSVKIPSTTGFASVSYANVGSMSNDGWEANVSAKKFIKIGKFSMDASFNVAQNFNEIKEMDQRVLDAVNSEWSATNIGGYQNRIQVGNALGSIYGFRYKGVYQYTYEYLTNMQKDKGWSSDELESYINDRLAAGETFPVVTDANGKVLMSTNGQPKRMVYNYQDGSSTYQFQGGDAIYEDINHDGQINALDIVYLGNSQPKVTGGFNLTFRYGNWSLKARFMYRYGNKIVNAARQALENMASTNNQCTTVNWRWRKDGDVTMIPRAMYAYSNVFNYQGSDRYVEDGSYIRFNNLQVSYNVPSKKLKKIGLNTLNLYFSMDNLACWTHYSGVDPEVSYGSWGVSSDTSKTPRAKSFTASINIGF